MYAKVIKEYGSNSAIFCIQVSDYTCANKVLILQTRICLAIYTWVELVNCGLSAQITVITFFFKYEELGKEGMTSQN